MGQRTTRNLNQKPAWFEDKSPQEILAWVNETFQTGKIALGTGFGASGVVLIDMIVKINKNIPMFYLDTELLFPETYELRDRLERRYGINFIRYTPEISLEEQAKLYGERLWTRDPDLCCQIRKVLPLQKALENYNVWITAIRRDQSLSRANVSVMEWENRFNVIKINPLASWTEERVWQYIQEHHLPYNPLHDTGYPSVGCWPCTTPIKKGEDERSGRWRGFDKIECGLHVQVRK